MSVGSGDGDVEFARRLFRLRIVLIIRGFFRSQLQAATDTGEQEKQTDDVTIHGRNKLRFDGDLEFVWEDKKDNRQMEMDGAHCSAGLATSRLSAPAKTLFLFLFLSLSLSFPRLSMGMIGRAMEQRQENLAGNIQSCLCEISDKIFL